MTVPFSVHYFNHSLNFFEPLVESTVFELAVDDKQRFGDMNQSDSNNQTIKVDFKHLLNINMSVALYECLWRIQSAFKLEKQNYETKKAHMKEHKSKKGSSGKAGASGKKEDRN